MSDLSATNCGCECGERNDCNNNCMWIILLLLFCGGCHNDCSGYGYGCDNNCLMIILLLFCCGGLNGGGCC